MNNSDFVSVIIPTYKDWDRLALCLNALHQQTFDQDKFEIIVVNNAPYEKMPQDFFVPINCTVISESKPGSYAARNAGLGISKGNIFGFTDSDCIPDKDWILNAVDYLTKTNVDRIGGGVSLFYKGTRPNMSELYDIIFSFPRERYVNHIGWAVTANMFARKKIFDAIGLYNDGLMSGGDQEWGKRAESFGYKIDYVPNAVINHPARASINELLKKTKRTGIGRTDLAFAKGDTNNPSLIRQLYIIFRLRTNDLPRIRQKIRQYNLGSFNIFLSLILRNIVLGYGDYHSFKRRRQLIKAQNRSGILK